MKQTQICSIGLFESYQDLAEAIQPRMASLYNPSACPMIRIRDFFSPFLATGSDMWFIASPLYRLASFFTVISLICTQVLGFFQCWIRTVSNYMVQNRLHLSDVMTVGSGDDDGERGTSAVHQEVALGPFFSPDPLDSFQRILAQEVLWSLPHRCSANPRQFLSIRHNRPSQLSRVPGKTQPEPTPESNDEWHWGNRSAPLARPSIDNRFAARRLYPRRPAGLAMACVHRPGVFCIACSGLEKNVESKVLPFSTRHPTLPTIELYPMHSSSGYRFPEVPCIKKQKMSRALVIRKSQLASASPLDLFMDKT